jgi:hypothetical protein
MDTVTPGMSYAAVWKRTTDHRKTPLVFRLELMPEFILSIKNLVSERGFSMARPIPAMSAFNSFPLIMKPLFTARKK